MLDLGPSAAPAPCAGPMVMGATQVIFEGVPTYPDAGRCWEVCDKYKVSLFYTAPTAIRSLMSSGDDFVTRHERSSLRVLGSVGEPINPEAWRWYYEVRRGVARRGPDGGGTAVWECILQRAVVFARSWEGDVDKMDHPQKGTVPESNLFSLRLEIHPAQVVGSSRCAVVDTYWQTETGAHMISPLPGATTMKPGSATFPFFGVEPAILDEKGNELEGACEG